MWNIFENMPDWWHVICIIEVKISLKSKTFHIKEWLIVQNGPKQHIMKMFDNYKSTYGDERITWRTIKMAFCNWNHVEESIRCQILLANFVQRRAWLLQILWCMPKNRRIGDSKFCKAGHKSSKRNIYEMGTWFCGAN
jgi:hypothetical protein